MFQNEKKNENKELEIGSQRKENSRDEEQL